jgi:hypothetical protein
VAYGKSLRYKKPGVEKPGVENLWQNPGVFEVPGAGPEVFIMSMAVYQNRAIQIELMQRKHLLPRLACASLFIDN